jgi:aspartate aminotransferase
VSYPEQITLAGGVVVPLPTGAAGRVPGLRRAAGGRADRPHEGAGVLLAVQPHRAVYPPAAVEAIGRWAAEHGIWVITDEIYEHLVFGDAEHVSMPVVVPELAERCVVANGVAKTYAMTGWRVGWSIAPLALTKAMTNLQSHATSNVANVSQMAALAAVAGPLDEVRSCARPSSVAVA